MLYQQLTQLVEKNKEFTRERIAFEGNNYEVFSYQLPSYTEFQLPGAINCRGTVFQIADNGEATLVCLPMPKFFNFEEGIQRRTDKKVILAEMPKLDGSMMKSIMVNGSIRIMGKTKFNDGYHPHAAYAETFLKQNPHLQEMLEYLETCGYTVCMEYTANDDEYICKSGSPKLTILMARHRDTFAILLPNEIQNFLRFVWKPEFEQYIVGYTSVNSLLTINDYVEEIRNRKDTEGSVVLVYNYGTGEQYLAKVKTTDYLLKHHSRSKSGFNHNSICQAIIRNISDDMKALHYKKPEKVQYIEELEECVRNTKRIILEDMALFMERNSEKTGKDFSEAIKTAGIPKELHGLYFQYKKDTSFDVESWFYNNTHVFKL